MKTISKGKLPALDIITPAWWNGMRHQCWYCKAIIELEPNDKVTTISDDEVSVACPTKKCNHTLNFKKR